MSLSAGAAETLLAFADDEHIIGQRHTEWIGVAPFLEEDLAMSSIAQDELGHAASLYELLVQAGHGSLTPSRTRRAKPRDPNRAPTRTQAANREDHTGTPRPAVDVSGRADALDPVDRLAFRRDPGEYRCCWLVEHPGKQWAFTLVRHWLYDRAERHRWQAVTGSSHAPLAALAARARREERYHRRHADALVDRLCADEKARPAVVAALDECLPLAVAMFEPTANEGEAAAHGVITATMPELRPRWWHEVSESFNRLGLPQAQDMPVPDPGLQRGRTLRSPHFARMHATINEVIDIDPTGRW